MFWQYVIVRSSLQMIAHHAVKQLGHHVRPKPAMAANSAAFVAGINACRSTAMLAGSSPYTVKGIEKHVSKGILECMPQRDLQVRSAILLLGTGGPQFLLCLFNHKARWTTTKLLL